MFAFYSVYPGAQLFFFFFFIFILFCSRTHRDLGIVHTKNDTGLMSLSHLSALIKSEVSFYFPCNTNIGEQMFPLSYFFYSHISSANNMEMEVTYMGFGI